LLRANSRVGHRDRSTRVVEAYIDPFGAFHRRGKTDRPRPRESGVAEAWAIIYKIAPHGVRES
jgi:hypothetical protein